MPLSRLENFLINTDGNILYVNPSDLDATDSFDNKGNSLTRPFKTLQRALIEAARFAYQAGQNNDRFDKTTILLYPGTHLIDNRPGYYINNVGGSVKYYDVNENEVSSPQIELTNSSILDINNSSNVLYKFNSVEGGVIIPKGTSVVGLDLRKTKVKPLYVPDPEDDSISRSALFRVTGGCYFWQFSMFDADRDVFYNKNFGLQRNPSFSHHKLTCFEYADGVNKTTLTKLTDLEMYYFKLMNAYGDDTGNRKITAYPSVSDFEPNNPEFRIVGALQAGDLEIENLTSTGVVATVTTKNAHNLTVDDSFRVTGINSETYNGTFRVTGITSERNFTYTMLADADQDLVNFPGGVNNPRVIIEADNVTGASPYIFNLSLRSTFGMCGLHADGNKATGFKSMVVAQFTGIGLQKDTNAFVIYNEATNAYDTNSSTASQNRPLYTNQNAVYKTSYENFHIKASNDAVIQAVSVFAIGFSNHFLAEGGADQSITNSNSNFGAKALVSKGFKNQSFNRDDTGYITHIVPPRDPQSSSISVTWRALDAVKTEKVGIVSHLYLLGETDQDNPPTNIVNGYRVGSNDNEVLYLDLNISGNDLNLESPILMDVTSGDGPSGKKVSTVSRTNGITDVSSNVFTLDANHIFKTGESVRVYSDDGIVPGGLENEGLYYIISTAVNKVSLASNLNNALASTPVPITITNSAGGILKLVSRVTDKLPGDLGHPVQFDSGTVSIGGDTVTRGWYITGTGTTTGASANSIYQGFIGVATAIEDNNASAYIKRTPDNRDLNDRIYKLRYVIPNDITTQTAKAPEKNFVLQESKSTKFDSAFTTLKDSRNPRIIAGITTAIDSGNIIATVTTEKPHGLTVDDRVKINRVVSTANTTGFNGYYTVTGITDTKKFTYTYDKADVAGTFDNDITSRTEQLPAFERNEYDTTYTIQDVETIQEYVKNEQDGIYYLTCLVGNISPSVSDFSTIKYKQSIESLYPTVDKDNLVLDPDHTASSASIKTLGKVIVNDSLNSVTKKSTIEYLQDNRIGFAITFAESSSSGISTITFNHNHNFNRISDTAITNGGSGYANGTYYNVPLTGGSGSDATATIVISGTSITTVTITDPGCAYQVTDVLSAADGNLGGGGGAGLQIRVDNIVNNVGDAIQVVGVGTELNRNYSAYNGLYEITDVPSVKSVEYSNGTNPGIYTSSSANSTGIAAIVSEALYVNLIDYQTSTQLIRVTTPTQHGLKVGNRVKISGLTGIGSTILSGDFIINKVISKKKFGIKSPVGVSTDQGLGSVRVMRYGLGAYGQDTSLATEKIGGSLIPMTSGLRTLLASTLNVGGNSITVDSTDGFYAGSFIQIDEEIIRITSVTNSSTADVQRGVLGTKVVAHDDNSVVTEIKVIPSEVRRFSSIRASGHTFEYVGYGPGNYSTSLPQRIQRTLSQSEELLAVSKEEKGGIVFFSGMNDRGDFFTGERAVPRETFLGEDLSDLTAVFDDLYVRNTLRVGGGPNQNLPSEFNGPVNFSNKLTSTDTEDGINAIKLLLKGSGGDDPFFQVGQDSEPSLVVSNQGSNFVGIKSATPAFELDVNGTIRATTYENFKLSDLPNNTTEETTFAKNRVLKVNEQGDGYVLVDPHELEAYKLSSYGISNDPTVYSGVGSNVNSKLQISGVSTSRFSVGEEVKIFGVTKTSDGGAFPSIPPVSIANKVGTATTSKLYRYWIAEYNYRNGKVGIATQINPKEGIGHVADADFNDQEHIALTVNRNSVNNGLLVYRQISNTGVSTNIYNAKLIAILGPKELQSDISSIIWKDYGVYEQTEWSTKDNRNQFTDEGQIHFPNIATTGQRRGWEMDNIVSIGNSTITVSGQYNYNNSVGFGTTSVVRVTHDNTAGLSTAIDDTVASGGNYLDLPSGTFITSKLIIPTGFTLRGNGKNTIIKQQYFANDSTDAQGNSLDFDGNFVGIAVTNGKDVTISDLTIDGNNHNNINYQTESDNYLVYLKGINSSLIKNIEIRNTPGHGLYMHDTKRVSVENCSFVDGSLTDRFFFQPFSAQDSETLRVNDSLFENFPGSVDLSVTSVTSTGGNIIRNCGTGLRTYASGKITTTNNIILGPGDEYIPSPDIYDSDFNSINVTIDRSTNFNSPLYLYLEKGDPKNISDSAIDNLTAGIGTIVGQGTTNETLGDKFLFMNVTNQNTETQNNKFTRDLGYLQVGLTTAQTATLGLTSALGYVISATEFITPVGYTTIGIQTGTWNTLGAGATNYTLTLSDVNQFAGISTGDIVKLVDHAVTPDLSTYELTVQSKISVDAATKQLRLIGITTDNPQQFPAPGGYIVVKNNFVIAKGRVGVI